MQIEKGYIYHIYNQGNNKQNIFFDRENYLYFLKKIKTYILPYGNIIAWCLMPNHFHIMVLVNETTVGVAQSDTDGIKAFSAQSNANGIKNRTINQSIGIMLRSYTSAINKQRNRSGKLIREKTKAECVNCPKGIAPSFIIKEGITLVNTKPAEKQYPQVCFNYIHENPVKAKLVQKISDWEFSSAKDYAGLRSGKLVSKEIASNYVVIQ